MAAAREPEAETAVRCASAGSGDGGALSKQRATTGADRGFSVAIEAGGVVALNKPGDELCAKLMACMLVCDQLQGETKREDARIRTNAASIASSKRAASAARGRGSSLATNANSAKKVLCARTVLAKYNDATVQCLVRQINDLQLLVSPREWTDLFGEELGSVNRAVLITGVIKLWTARGPGGAIPVADACCCSVSPVDDFAGEWPCEWVFRQVMRSVLADEF
jgi:hypothetical protein